MSRRTNCSESLVTVMNKNAATIGIQPLWDQDPWWEKYDQANCVLNHRFYLAIKRMLDIAAVLLSAPFWLPVFLVILVTLKLGAWGSPALFLQYRTGLGGHRFKMYKFRTMVPNAEELKKEYAHLNELQWPDFKITNDPRITRLGSFLRKTSLDEIPQLWNVLTGDMSLVGPRPTSFSADTYKLWHTERLDVTPGVTGLWQIVGRGSTEFDYRLRLDIAYKERRTLLLDLVILIKTFTSVLQQRGAK